MRYYELKDSNDSIVIYDNVTKYRLLDLDEFKFLAETDHSDAYSSSTKLYRGVNTLTGKPSVRYVEATRSSNRKSISGNFVNRRAFDSMMEHKGLPFRKNNTVSTSTSKHDPFTFGTVFKCYPANGTKYLYSNLKDFIKFHNKDTVYDFIEAQGLDESDEALFTAILIQEFETPEHRELYKVYLDWLWEINGFNVINSPSEINTSKDVEVIFIPSKPFLLHR